MTVIINPGSENTGGTYKQAEINANGWLESMHKDGFKDVIMDDGRRLDDGDYEFVFTHSITKQKVLLHIHGFTDKECERFTFHPRVYWNGSSTADPKIEDWITGGFDIHIKYIKK